MTVFRTAPTYDLPITVGNKTHAAWYRWFQNIDLGIPPSSEVMVTPTASPFTYSPKVKGMLIVSAGTVSRIDYSRTPGVFYNTGQTAGVFTMSANDQIKITYSGVPTVVFMPS